MSDLVVMNDLKHSSGFMIPSGFAPGDLPRVRVESSRFVNEVDDGEAGEEGVRGLVGRLPKTVVNRIVTVRGAEFAKAFM
jgi:hypothetical protein